MATNQAGGARPRDEVAGPDEGPEPPFPLRLNGEVIKGFGRGSGEVSDISVISHVAIGLPMGMLLINRPMAGVASKGGEAMIALRSDLPVPAVRRSQLPELVPGASGLCGKQSQFHDYSATSRPARVLAPAHTRCHHDILDPL